MTQSVLRAWRCSTLHAVLHEYIKVNSHHCRTDIQIFPMLPQYHDRFTYTTFTFTCFMYIRVVGILIHFVFCIMGPSVWVKSGGRTAVGSWAIREADIRLGVKGYGVWRSGWTPCLSPVALLIFMFLVFTSLGDVPDHCIKLAWFRI